jgi:uncharacterized protein (DUF983 family)
MEMKIRVNINHHFCEIHCPSCGCNDFTRPKNILKGWSRCFKCGTDIHYNQEESGALNIVAVMEDFENPIYDKYRKVGSKP